MFGLFSKKKKRLSDSKNEDYIDMDSVKVWYEGEVICGDYNLNNPSEYPFHNLFPDGDGGAVTDHNGTVLFGFDKPKKFNTMIVDHSWIVKKSDEKTLSIKGGPGMPELQFVRSGNDLFYIKDCDNCEKTAILMEKGTTPRLSLHRIRLVGMTAEQYKCTQTD